MCLHGPMDYAKKAETAISCREPGKSTRKKKEAYQQSGGGRGYRYVPVWHNNRE